MALSARKEHRRLTACLGTEQECPWPRQVFLLAEPRLSSQSLKLFLLLDLFSLVIDRAPNQILEDLDLNPSLPYFVTSNSSFAPSMLVKWD